MKLRVSIVIFILLSFLNMGAVSKVQIKNNSFSDLESVCMNKSKFVENGYKLQYKTKNTIEEEIFRITKYLEKFSLSNYKYEQTNNLKFYNNDLSIDVKLWDDDEYTYVAVILLNSNSDYKTKDLIRTFNGLKTYNLEDIQYFLYYKGRISDLDEKKYTDYIKQSMNRVDLLDLNNGYTGVGYCINGEKINFAVTTYDTGRYIIIGSPIIFTTY